MTTSTYPVRVDATLDAPLDRWLWLVKWAMVIPHYLVVAVFLGGGVYVANQAMISEGAPWLWGGGLIGLPVLLAAVVLLFTGRYPRGIFDLVLGMNRWVLRVAAYAGLMTDAYPPCRLDMGPTDPGSGRLRFDAAAPDPPPAPPPAPGPSTRPWTTGRIVAVTVGSLLLALSGGLLTGGVALAVADHGMRDDAGFLTSGAETFSTGSYAITTENLEFHVSTGAEWAPRNLLGDTRLTVDADEPVFLGIAATADVERYLADVPHAELTDYRAGDFGGTPRYRDVAGSDVPAPPADLDIWVAQATGAGERSLTWTPRNGDWTAVLMNADGTTGVRADVRAGAALPALDWAVPVLLSVGGTLLVLSIALVAGALLVGRGREEGTS